jgi:hypothetical protein
VKPEILILYWFDCFYANIVPASIMLILNIATVKTLFKSRFQSTVGVSKKDIRFALTCFTLNIHFFILLIFYQISFLIKNGDTSLKGFNFFFHTLTSSLYTINYAESFYINLMINKMFREEFFKLFNEIKTFLLK